MYSEVHFSNNIKQYVKLQTETRTKSRLNTTIYSVDRNEHHWPLPLELSGRVFD